VNNQGDQAKREQELALILQELLKQKQGGGQQGLGSDFNPTDISSWDKYFGQNGALSGLFSSDAGSTGVTAGTSAAHTGGAMGADSGGMFSGLFGGGGSSAGGGAGYSLASFWPAAVVAAIVGNEKYQENTGNRKGEMFPGEQALEGRAFFKDAPVWGDKADSVIPGLGSDIRIAGDLGSPFDLLHGSTYSDLWNNLKSGGILGGLFKSIF
jgi:hypothetical protein